MARYSSIFAFLFLVALFSLGCSSRTDSQVNPVFPDERASFSEGADNVLLGFYDVYIDIASKTATAVLNRQAMFAINIVNALNKNPKNLGLVILETPIGTNFVDVDINISVTHPFPGLTQYNVYDMRGIFIGDGSFMMKYNQDLRYSAYGIDQFMMADSDDGIGNPDGYTRWYNNSEFSMGGPPIFQYTKGIYSTKGYEGSATLCPYKYFADGLDTTENLWDWLNEGTNPHGVFSAGSKATRNYYLRFPYPAPKVCRFGYAIVANWGGPNPADHPSNAPEAVACSIDVTPDLFINDNNCLPKWGGDLIADVSLFGWKEPPSKIFIESTVLDSVYELNPTEMIPTGSGDNYSTYHFEVEADQIQDTEGNEFWVIAEYDDYDYTNPYGVPNLADTDPLIAAFRYDLFISPSGYCPEVLVGDIYGMEGQSAGGTEQAKKGITYGKVWIDGEGFFGPPVIVKLYNHDNYSMFFEADEVVFLNDYSVSCTITIPESVDTGMYDVYVENCCGMSGFGYNMVEIIE